MKNFVVDTVERKSLWGSLVALVVVVVFICTGALWSTDLQAESPTESNAAWEGLVGLGGIDLDSIVTEVPLPTSAKNGLPLVALLTPEAVSTALELPETLVDGGMDGDERFAFSEHYELHVNAKTGLFSIGQVVPYEEPEEAPVESTLDEVEVFDMAVQDLTALGLDFGEVARIDVRQARGMFGPSCAEGVVDRPLAFQVFVWRHLGGIAVPSSKLFMMYGLDGTFKKLAGSWPPVKQGMAIEVALTKNEALALVLTGAMESDELLGAPKELVTARNAIYLDAQGQLGALPILGVEFLFPTTGPYGRQGPVGGVFVAYGVQ